MLPVGAVSFNPHERAARAEELSQLLLDDRLDGAKLPPGVAEQLSPVSQGTVDLPVGVEQKLQLDQSSSTGRVFYVNHSSRATTWTDPRQQIDRSRSIKAKSANDAEEELQTLCSAVLPEQAVGASDFREALHHALRGVLASPESSSLVDDVAHRDDRRMAAAPQPRETAAR